MIPSITYEDIIRVIRRNLINYLGIDNNRVLNADSVRGTDLTKIINDSESTSYNLNDLFIVFRLKEDDSEKYVILKEEDGTMSSISSFEWIMNIYGNACHSFSQSLLTLFKEENFLNSIRENGVYIKEVKAPRFMNEFINNTMWARCDISITIQVRFSNEELSNEGYIENYFDPAFIIRKVK